MYILEGNVTQRFAARLKDLRESAGLTQGKLAEKLGVSRGSISYYENCDRVPDIEFLEKCSEYFGVADDYMLGYTCNLKPVNLIIGKKLGLSDKAIDFFDWNDDFGDELSDLIENESFQKFYEICKAYLQERDWRRIKSSQFAVAYPIEIEELDRFRAYRISKLFVSLLESTRAKIAFENNYPEGTGKDLRRILAAAENNFNSAIEKYNKMKESFEVTATDFSEWTDEEIEDFEIRKKAIQRSIEVSKKETELLENNKREKNDSPLC